MLSRNLTRRLLAALADTPIVYLHGARQCGKSTLVRALAASTEQRAAQHPATYLTFDDAATLAAAQGDPAGFLGGLEGRVILDEFQRVPDLALALKRAVDRDRTPGRFLLTGSADALVVPGLAQSLVGRIEILTLWPLSQGEISGRVETFIDRLLDDSDATSRSEPTAKGGAWRAILDRMVAGGFPEALGRVDADRRAAWFGSYLTTILQRDVRDLSRVEGLAEFPNLLRLLAARSGTLLSYAELSRSLATPVTTLKRYLSLLEATFLVQFVPPWASNLGKRLVKAPKILLCDTGLLCSLLGVDVDRLSRDSTLAGHVLENFVAMELRKQATWSRTRTTIHHYRSHAQHEVDLLLEDPAGRIAAVEVKAAVTLSARDFAGLRHLEETLGDRFIAGVVLYAGRETIPFGPRMRALPIDALWS